MEIHRRLQRKPRWHLWAQLNAFGKQLVDAPAATLTKNTQVQIVNSFQITQAAAIPIPGWTECERVYSKMVYAIATVVDGTLTAMHNKMLNLILRLSLK